MVEEKSLESFFFSLSYYFAEKRLTLVEDTLTDEQIDQLNLEYAARMQQSRISYLDETDEERDKRQATEKSNREINERTSDAVFWLSRLSPEIFLHTSYPYEESTVSPGLRLTQEGVGKAIEFLEAIRERVTR